MAKSRDGVSWTALALIVGLSTAVVGGGFIWLRGDIHDVRTDTKEIAADVKGIRSDMSEIRREAALMNQNLTRLIEKAEKR